MARNASLGTTPNPMAGRFMSPRTPETYVVLFSPLLPMLTIRFQIRYHLESFYRWFTIETISFTTLLCPISLTRSVVIPCRSSTAFHSSLVLEISWFPCLTLSYHDYSFGFCLPSLHWTSVTMFIAIRSLFGSLHVPNAILHAQRPVDSLPCLFNCISYHSLHHLLITLSKEQPLKSLEAIHLPQELAQTWRVSCWMLAHTYVFLNFVVLAWNSEEQESTDGFCGLGPFFWLLIPSNLANMTRFAYIL